MIESNFYKPHAIATASPAVQSSELKSKLIKLHSRAESHIQDTLDAAHSNIILLESDKLFAQTFFMGVVTGLALGQNSDKLQLGFEQVDGYMKEIKDLADCSSNKVDYSKIDDLITRLNADVENLKSLTTQEDSSIDVNESHLKGQSSEF